MRHQHDRTRELDRPPPGPRASGCRDRWWARRARARRRAASMSGAIRTRACSPPERRPTGIGELLGCEEETPRPAGDVDRAARRRRPDRPAGASARRSVTSGSSAVRCWSSTAMREPVGALDATRVGRELAGEDADQRRLAAAVRPEEAEPRAGTEDQAHVVEDRDARRSAWRRARRRGGAACGAAWR